jgi:hypothetical protein
MGTAAMKKWHTTHIQPHEPLLVGRFIHGMTTSNNSKTAERRMTTGRRRGRGKPNEKAQETSTTSLAPQVFFSSRFIFILQTNAVGTNTNYLQRRTDNTRWNKNGMERRTTARRGGNNSGIRGRERQQDDGERRRRGSDVETRTAPGPNHRRVN